MRHPGNSWRGIFNLVCSLIPEKWDTKMKHTKHENWAMNKWVATVLLLVMFNNAALVGPCPKRIGGTVSNGKVTHSPSAKPACCKKSVCIPSSNGDTKENSNAPCNKKRMICPARMPSEILRLTFYSGSDVNAFAYICPEIPTFHMQSEFWSAIGSFSNGNPLYSLPLSIPLRC